MKIEGNVLVKVDKKDIKNGKFVIPDYITEIKCLAFQELSSLETVIIPNGVTKIGFYAFNDCTSLGSVILPDTITKIEQGAFSGCTSLKEIELSKNVTEIEENAFHGCKSLKEIDIPENVLKIGKTAFCLCENLEKVTLPNSLVKIGEEAFMFCYSLKSIIIPNSVLKMGKGVFRNCDSLKDVTYSSNMDFIPAWAFEGCNLNNMTFSKVIKYMGEDAFIFATLKNITFTTSLIDIKYNYILLFKKSDSMPNVIIYGRKIYLGDFDEEIKKVRQEELLDKIINYLMNNGVFNKKHYQYEQHKEFLQKTAKKFEYIINYSYEDDLNRYMDLYMNTNHLKLNDEKINANLKILNDNVVNHNVDEFNPSGAIDIINYGDELLENISKVEELVAMIPDNYGPTNMSLEEELDKLRKPRNIMQFFESIKGKEKFYLGKDSIELLYYCTANNTYRLNLGIKKLSEVQKILELYIEKMNDYRDNLLNYRIITMNADELHKNDDIFVQNKVNKKVESYDKHLILVSDLYEKINNLIDCYKIYMSKLQRIGLLLEKIKNAKQINKGIVSDKESLESLREILDFYEGLDDQNTIKR